MQYMESVKLRSQLATMCAKKMSEIYKDDTLSQEDKNKLSSEIADRSIKMCDKLNKLGFEYNKFIDELR